MAPTALLTPPRASRSWPRPAKSSRTAYAEAHHSIRPRSVHPREVVKLALEKGAAACLLVHNHPSTVQDQSHADELITKRLIQALALIDVRVLDHLIVAGGSVFSFAEKGLI